MRTFIIFWFGQLVSTIGTYMTGFALELWTWETTGSATPLALIGFFFQVPRIVINLVSGVIVDRFNRKYLMLLGDTIAVFSSLILLLLSLTHTLQLWHLYLTTVIVSIFSQLQELSYSASISLLVPAQQYTRVSSMGSALHYGSLIIAPAIAATLYPIIGLNGILGIDCFTFLIAIATLLPRRIPQPEISESSTQLLRNLIVGFRLLFTHPSLRSLLLLTLPFGFVHDLGEALYTPMVLARTNGSATVLGKIGLAAGLGGVTGAIAVSLWGGFRQPIRGVLLSMIGAGLSKMTVGLGRVPQVWLPAQFCSSCNFPLMESSETAIWMTNVKPEAQGRVFAANSLLGQCLSAIASLIAGPLGDQIVEPAIISSTGLVRWIFGASPGAGFALIYTSCSLSMIEIGLCGYFSNVYVANEDT
ncbi:MFS transporter [Leptolyngbya sp. FACHB-17]|uniref:MFS transporter n=1 Tax=unclassified Leptolyngbya TaxID=2650499 RepID=UPI0016818636|nr:MFS transporter [Leptolyngbya sp. FACHB-17]MBD2078963.1 MFS transporter [Leptolyngbya sp. FACHB-17]